MTRPLNVVCLQTRPKPDIRSALDEALSLAEVAADAGGQLLTLPEYCGGLTTKGKSFVPPAMPEEEHPVLKGLQDFAKSRKVWVIVGSVAISGSAGKICNRSFTIDDMGCIRSRYDKIHLFDIQLSQNEVYRESALISRGKHAVLSNTPLAIIGHSICYDLRFPGLYRELARAGAEILMVPAAFTKKTGEAHWHILNRARAIENGAFVVAPCAVGPIDGGGESYGHSLIVNPWGEVLADGGITPGIVQATIDLDEVSRIRRKIPSLEHDQPFTLNGNTQRNVA